MLHKMLLRACETISAFHFVVWHMLIAYSYFIQRKIHNFCLVYICIYEISKQHYSKCMLPEKFFGNT